MPISTIIESSPGVPGFAALALAPALMQALPALGFEQPSPIQAAAIPPLLAGRDVLGQAQTGTGKTAAFALPILSRLDPAQRPPQALVLTPTRELALQVAEAFRAYAMHLDELRVLPIYGGTGYREQLKALRRGVQVVVGTPGRVLDHLRRGTLDLSQLRFAVLDEADEMLQMGFAAAVDEILAAAPATRQTALFSATMPQAIQAVARRHLRTPLEIHIAASTTTVATIRQRYWLVAGLHKLDALTRILEAEPFEAALIFARTRRATNELAAKLRQRGLAAAALNGDLAQAERERLVARLRDGELDLLVATDVAARGLDVERISHVVNYDVPYDVESYVHRIGRTGRAGRHGEAILFVTARERGMLRAIERGTRQHLEAMALPTVAAVNERRMERFMQRIDGVLAGSVDLESFRALLTRYQQQRNVSVTDAAAALACLVNAGQPLLLEAIDPPPHQPALQRESKRRQRGMTATATASGDRQAYRLAVGRVHHATARNIIGAITHEVGIDGAGIGRLVIGEQHSTVELPAGLPAGVQRQLQRVRVAGRALSARPDVPEHGARPPVRHRAARRHALRRVA